MQGIHFKIITLAIICITGCSRQYDESLKIIYQKSGIIYSIDQDGTGREQITEGSTPSPSPTGEQIVHQKVVGFQQICITDINTLTTYQVTNTAFQNWGPTWSPDGKKILFYSLETGTNQIFLMNTDGTGKIQLTNTASANITPSFFPDDRIVFISTRDGQAEIYVMNSDGSNQVRMTFDDLYETPIISPDGKNIAYIRINNIFIADINMTNTRQLTTANVNTRISWSPDGEKIVFASGPDLMNLDIYTIKTNGKGMRQITSDTGSEDYPGFEFKPR